MRTSVQPVTLFGCEVPGMFQVTTGRTPVALVKTDDGKKLKIISVQDRAGGKPGEFGMTAPQVIREIRQLVGDVQLKRTEKAVTAAVRKDKPCQACRAMATCVWYWSGGAQAGEWRQASLGTRAGLIRMGYYAINGEPKWTPREMPPAEWFANFHRHSYREAMVEVL